MEIGILPDTEAIVSLAADAIGNLLRRKPDAVLGLATGSSPLAIYDTLTARCADHPVSFAQASGFTLDEYVGLAADHPERYRNVIDTEFVSRVDLAPGAVQGPDGLAEDIPAACAAYESAIAQAGGVDLQILGIGTDGPIGFNEPGSSLASRTRIKRSGRRPSCSIIRTRRCCWTAQPRAGCSWPTTTGRPTGPSRPGRASDRRNR